MATTNLTRAHEHMLRSLDLLPDNATRHIFMLSVAAQLLGLADDGLGALVIENALDIAQREPKPFFVSH